jgi:hypothetical protein
MGVYVCREGGVHASCEGACCAFRKDRVPKPCSHPESERICHVAAHDTSMEELDTRSEQLYRMWRVRCTLMEVRRGG